MKNVQCETYCTQCVRRDFWFTVILQFLIFLIRQLDGAVDERSALLKNFMADFAVFDGWRYCKVLCDVKFRQLEGKFLKISSHRAKQQLTVCMYNFMLYIQFCLMYFCIGGGQYTVYRQQQDILHLEGRGKRIVSHKRALREKREKRERKANKS